MTTNSTTTKKSAKVASVSPLAAEKFVKALKRCKKLYNVYQTTDLTIFTPSPYNRNVEVRSELMASIKKNGFDIFRPIIVTRQSVVIDGGTRLATLLFIIDEAKGALGTRENSKIPITFYIDESVEEEDMPNAVLKYNVEARPWAPKDFYKNVLLQKIPAYVDFNKYWTHFLKANAKCTGEPFMPIGAAVMFYTHGVVTTGKQSFKYGFMPMGDGELILKAAEITQRCNVKKTKTEYYKALMKWLLYFDPLLSDGQRRAFERNLQNYNEMNECVDHLKTWCSYVGYNYRWNYSADSLWGKAEAREYADKNEFRKPMQSLIDESMGKTAKKK